MRKHIMIMIVTIISAISLAIAAPPEGKGNGKGKPDVVHPSDKNVPKKIINDDTITQGVPPGLQDKTPEGLAKQGKVPEGWSKGEKRGWDDNVFKRTWDRFLNLFRND